MSSLKFDVDYFPVTGETEKIQQNNSSLLHWCSTQGKTKAL